MVALSPPASEFGALDAAWAIASAAVEGRTAIVSGDGHAAGMLVDHPDLIDRVVRWVDDAT